jgi:Leucine-rich repeat (LRR) protein
VSDSGPEISRLSSEDCRNAHFEKITFSPSKDTVFLNLTFKGITNLKNECFLHVNATGLTTVYLNDNCLAIVEPEVFRPLEELKHLYLQNNRISNLHPSTFQTNKNLITLDLSGNRLKKISADIFENNHFLSWVNVARNPLDILDIQPKMFSYSLNTLDIDFCKTEIHSLNSFQNIPYLKQLNLKESKEFTVQTFKPYQNMKFEEIHLEDNMFSKLGYNEQDELRYDEIKKVIFSPSNDSLMCFCSHLSAWFWCNEMASPCKSNVDHVYSLLNCSRTSEPLPQPQATLTIPTSLPATYTETTVIYNKTNSKDNESISGITSKPVNEDRNVTITDIIPYVVAIPIITIFLLAIAISVYFYKKKRKRNTREWSVNYSNIPVKTSEPSTNVTQLNHTYSVPYMCENND